MILLNVAVHHQEFNSSLMYNEDKKHYRLCLLEQHRNDFTALQQQSHQSSVTGGVNNVAGCCLSLSVLTAIFPRWPALLELRMMEVMVTTGAIRRAKLQSNCYHHKPTPNVLQAGCPSCHPTNSVRALRGKYHIPRTCSPKLTWGFSNFVIDH